MAFLTSTTGIASPVVIDDLGARSLVHPTVDIDLQLEYSLDELSASEDLKDAITTGKLTVTDEHGNPLTTNDIFGNSFAETPLGNLTATTDPTPNDDSVDGYSIGSIWINITTNESFICLDNTYGAAIWKQESNDATIQSIQKEAPNLHFLGGLLDYPNKANMTITEQLYMRVWLTAGLVFDRMETFIVSGGTAARNIRLGIYDQADPDDVDGVPRDLVASTAEEDTDGLTTAFKILNLTSVYTISTTGYYWLALRTDASPLEFASTATNNANFLPVRIEAGLASNTVLSDPAGVTTTPTTSALWLAALEQ